jgi:hypothetical protein
VKLQPSPLAGDGCTATADVVVDDALTEVVIDLDDESFPLPAYCNGSGTAVGSVKTGLFAIDVINPAVNAGAHEVSIGTIKLGR